MQLKGKILLISICLLSATASWFAFCEPMRRADKIAKLMTDENIEVGVTCLQKNRYLGPGKTLVIKKLIEILNTSTNLTTLDSAFLA